MIIKEYYKTREDGIRLNRTYSNKGFYIKKAGRKFLYAEAIDPAYIKPKYEETDILIEDKKTTKE